MPISARRLDAAHKAGVVHRDIKPENIMLRPDGVVKVVDFGLARVTGRADGPGLTETLSGLVMGTPRYMSPEQARGEKSDARADIFSLDAVLYEMAARDNGISRLDNRRSVRRGAHRGAAPAFHVRQ